MKNLNKCIFLLLILIVIFNYSCSEEVPVLPATPIANAGEDKLVEAFDTVYLSGSLGKISEGAQFFWSFDYKPEGSNSFFSDSSSLNPHFIPDVEGFYNIQLIVKAGNNYSNPDFVLIQSIYRKSEHYFPSTMGSKWVYKTSNSYNEVDTLTFEIVGESTKTMSKQGTIWISDINTHSYFYNWFDTLYFESIADTVIFKKSWGNNWEILASYVIPLIVGNTWDDSFGYYLVEEESNVGTFTNAYKIKERRERILSVLTTNSWFVPYIGLVKRDIYESDWGIPVYEEHWELIWYHLDE